MPRQSELAKDLWPYLRERVEAITRAGVSAGGSGGGGALTPHALSGAYHTGTLDVADGGTGASTAAGARVNLGLEIGVDVMAYDAGFDAFLGLSYGDGQFIVGNGTGWVNESGNTARTSLGLGTGDSPTFAGLTVNGNIAVTGTVDGVDVADHSARHESGGADTVNHDNLVGFVADEHIAHSGVTFTAGSGLTGGGTIAASRTFNVGAGDGIDVAADAVSVDVTDFIDTAYGLTESSNDIRINLASPSGLAFSSGALQVADAIAGAGLAIASKVLAVGAGDGIDVAADAISVDVTDLLGTGLTEDASNNLVLPTPSTLTVSTTNTRDASGHAHAVTASSSPGAATSLLKTDANGSFAFDTDTLYVSATQDAVWVNSGTPDGSAAFKVQAAATGDITFYTKQIAGQTADMWRVEDASGTALILLQEDGDLESGNPGFVSGLTGWQISHTGDVEFNNGFFRGELHASVFVLDEIHATGGTVFVATASKLLTSVDTSSGAASIGVGMESGDGVLMESGDRVLMEVSSALALDIEDPPSGHAQIFSVGDTLRLKTWTGAGVYDNWMSVVSVEDQTTFYRYWVRLVSGTGGVIPAGTAVVSYGVEGDGRILLTSDQNYAPYIDIFSVGPYPWSGSAGAIVPHVRMGRLDGVGLVGTEQYGIVMGTDLSDTSLDAPYIIASDQQLRLNNIDLTIYNASNNPTVSLTSSGALKLGTDVEAASTTGFYFDATTGDLLIGQLSGSYVHYQPGTPLLDISAQVHITGNSEINGSLEVSNGTLSRTSGSQYNMRINNNSAGFGLFNPVNYSYESLIVSYNAATEWGTSDPGAPSGPIGTFLAVGDVGIGNPVAANAWWDSTAGQLKFRNGTTVRSYIDTDGSFVAGGGTVVLNDNGVSILADTAYGLENAIAFVNGSAVVVGHVYSTVVSNDASVFLESFSESTGDGYAAVTATTDGGSMAKVTLSAIEDGVGSAQLSVIRRVSGQSDVEILGGPIRLDPISVPGGGVNPSAGGWLYVSSSDGDLYVKFANGTEVKLASN